MRKFLRNIGICVLALVVLAIGMEIAGEAISNSYTYKREYMETHGGEIKTLILGSSNAYDGLNPSELPAAFNLANSSQTLEDDYQLLAKYIGDMDSLETVIIGLGYHSFGEAQEAHRKTYYTIYMDLYPRWPISKNSLEIGDMRLLTKKIVKYVVSRDVTRCDSLGQRLGHTRAAAEEQREWWNKSAEELARGDSFERDKNIKNTVCADININREEIKNAESSDTDRISTVTDPQSACEQAPRQTDDQFRLIDIDAQYPSDDSLQKCASLTKNNKKCSWLSTLDSRLSTNITYLYEIVRLCEANGVRPVLVQMPVMKEYKDALPKEQVALQDSVLKALESKAVCIDASEWEIPEDGWYNATHLTREASAEFTQRVSAIILR